MGNERQVFSKLACRRVLPILLPLAILTTSCTPSTEDPEAQAQKLNNRPTSVLEEPSWGESLSDISNRHPEGQSFQIADGEQHYRVLVQAYGRSRALVTFCLRGEIGLHLVVIEFPASDSQVDVGTGDYTRPSLSEGQAIHQMIVEKLADLYGRATHVRGEPNHGGLMVFGKQHGEFIRLDSTLASRDQLNVTVWQVNRSIETNETNVDKAVVAGLWRTPSSTWAKTPVFDVNWGMGPGDVRDKYRDLTAILSDPHQAIQSYDVNAFIEGRVGMDFDFFEGRLIGIKMSPFFYSDGEISNNTDREQTWAEWDYWRDQIRAILQEKYGAPGSGHVQSKYLSEEGSNAAANAWVWETDETGILLRAMGRIPILEYRELESAQARENATRDYEDQQEKAKKDKF